MIKEMITRIASKYGATLIFSTTTDSIWKYEKQIATLTAFQNFFDKLNCEHEIADEFRKLNLDNTIRGQFNPDMVTIEWRNPNE